jgi:hypothetical protein
MGMLDHNIIDVLKTLTPKEIIRLTEFLSSPYYNKSSKLLKLYQELLRFYPLFLDSTLTRESIGKKLNKDGIYKDSELRDYLSKLLSVVKEFLVVERLNSKSNLKNLLVLNETSDRNLNALFDKYLGQLENEILDHGLDHERFLNNYHLKALIFNNIGTNSKVKKLNQAETEIEHLLKCAQNLTIYNFLTQIILYINVVIHRNKFNVESEDNSLSSSINMLSENISQIKLEKNESKIVELYNLLYLSFKNHNDSSFYFEYKNYFNKRLSYWSSEEIKFHNAKLISYCILQKRINREAIDWRNELFDLYKQFLGKKLYLTRYEKYLSYNLYRDIMINAINLNKSLWLKEFIDKYTSSLNPIFRKNMKIYSMSYLAFSKRQFSRVLELTSKIDLDYFIYKYDVKNLQLAAYYENNDLLGVSDLIHAYDEALRKEKLLSKDNKVNYKNYLLYLRKLIASEDDKGDLGYYFQKLLQERKIVFKRWLVDKYQVKISSLQYNISINY